MTKPIHSVVENDEYFYRHPEMYRNHLEEEIEVFDSTTRVSKKQ